MNSPINLDAVWQDLLADSKDAQEQPESLNGSYSVAAVTHGHCFGRDDHGHPCLFIATKASNAKIVPIELNELDIVFSSAFKVGLGNSDPRTFTVIRCKSDKIELHRCFMHACEVVLQIIGSEPTEDEVQQAIESLVKLFKSLDKNPAMKAAGLFGELFFIYMSRNPKKTLEAWQSQNGERYDFSTGNIRIEVKSSSHRKREHHFSLEQCIVPEGTIGLAISLFVERNGDGLALRSLIEKILERVEGNLDLEIKLWSMAAEILGSNFPKELDITFDEELARESFAIYALSEIPAIQLPLPQGVSRVTFTSDISEIDPIAPSKLETGYQEIIDYLPEYL